MTTNHQSLKIYQHSCRAWKVRLKACDDEEAIRLAARSNGMRIAAFVRRYSELKRPASRWRPPL